MAFARRVFLLAGLYGLLVLSPLYFTPPPAEGPEYFYGFIGVALAWQVLFLVVSRDPLRYRPVMLPSVLEKLGFGLAASILFLQTRVEASIFAAGLIDLVWGGLFLAAWTRTRSELP